MQGGVITQVPWVAMDNDIGKQQRRGHDAKLYHVPDIATASHWMLMLIQCEFSLVYLEILTAAREFTEVPHRSATLSRILNACINRLSVQEWQRSGFSQHYSESADAETNACALRWDLVSMLTPHRWVSIPRYRSCTLLHECMPCLPFRESACCRI